MLNKLFEDALLATSYASSDSESVQRAHEKRRPVIEAQIEVVKQAMRLLKSIRADVEAMRLDDSDHFAGTGKCEFGHEGVEVTLEWPNLAILSDDIDCLLKTVEKLDTPKVWFVFFGDCRQYFRCEAEDREEATALCARTYPGQVIHVAIPATCHGELVMEGYGEYPVSCPKCGGRTEFGELPREDWQVHVCQRCNHSFIAIPDEEEVTP